MNKVLAVIWQIVTIPFKLIYLVVMALAVEDPTNAPKKNDATRAKDES